MGIADHHPARVVAAASDGGTVTRMRTVSSGDIGGNQVVQLPPVRVAMRPEEEKAGNPSGGGKGGI
jgi:hypothetical protein